MLKLANAYATTVRDQNDNKWLVYSKDGEELGRFPSKWDERDCMTAIRLGREFELEAFNIGIDFGKEKMTKVLLPKLEQLTNQIAFLEEQNLKLSSKIEQFILAEDDS